MKNLDKFKVLEVYQNDSRIYRALLSEKKDLMRVEVKSKVEENEAEKYIEVEIARMKALFQNAASPYPGEISDEIECSEEFKPVLKTTKQTNVKMSYFSRFFLKKSQKFTTSRAPAGVLKNHHFWHFTVWTL